MQSLYIAQDAGEESTKDGRGLNISYPIVTDDAREGAWKSLSYFMLKKYR